MHMRGNMERGAFHATASSVLMQRNISWRRLQDRYTGNWSHFPCIHLAAPVAMQPVVVAIDDAAAIRTVIAGDGADGEGGRDGVLENDARAGASAHLLSYRKLTINRATCTSYCNATTYKIGWGVWGMRKKKWYPC